VVAVRGHMDRYSAASGLPKTALADISGTSVYVLHDLFDLDLDPAAAGISVVVHGHTHHADITWKNGVLYLNPGSARARADRTSTIARLTISGDGIVPEIIRLDPSLYRPAL
jgi:predicted phosphodiesterase